MQDIALFLEKCQLLYRFSITLKHVITHYISKKIQKEFTGSRALKITTALLCYSFCSKTYTYALLRNRKVKNSI